MTFEEFTQRMHDTVDKFKQHISNEYPEMNQEDMEEVEWYEQLECYVELYGVSDDEN